MFDKNYFLTRLANGESMDVIGEEIAAMMNEAVAEHEAQKAEAERIAMEQAAEAALIQTKRDLARDLVDLILEYGELVAPGVTVDLDVSDEELDMLIQGMDEMFQMMTALNKLKTITDTKAPVQVKVTGPKVTKSDDEALNDFLKSLFG